MKKNLLLSLMLGGIGMAASAAVTTTPKLAMTLNAAESGLAVDKQNNSCPAIVEYKGTDAIVSILNSDFSVKKQFTIKNVNGEENGSEITGTYCWGDFMSYDTGADAIVSQGIYNSDDKWEVVVCTVKTEMVKDPEGYEYETPVRSYKVVNEDNEEVCVPMDYGYDEILEYTYINNRFYVVLEDEDANTIQFYTYEAGASALPAIPVTKAASRAYPNPLPSGRILTIEFENEAEEGTEVEVYDMRGRKVCSVAVAEGETKAQVPSRRLRGGNYVYVVNRNGNLVEKGKIIAR